jgi:hypothetical protein
MVFCNSNRNFLISFQRVETLLRISFVLLFVSCSTVYNKSYDYYPTTKSLVEQDIDTAIEVFPSGESGAFITTLEKTYLNLLKGNPEIEKLEWFAEQMEGRVRYEVSRELKDFFYVDTSDGYYASEHEIIWMHLLLSWGNIMLGDKDKALIHIRKASNFLGGEWSHEGPFDDPILRIFLASMWRLTDHWEEARVEYRKAYYMDKSMGWALQLSQLKSPPKKMTIVLGYPGREPVWDPKLEWNVVRGFRDLKFTSKGKESKIQLKDSKGRTLDLGITSNSQGWYERHLERDNAINELIQDSKYGQRMALNIAKNTVAVTGGVALGITIGIAGLIVGGGLVYLGAEGNSSDLAAVGVLVIAAGLQKGGEIASDSIDNAKEDFVKTANVAQNYRYVRYLPDYIWVGYTNADLEAPIQFQEARKPISATEIIPPNKNLKTNFYFYPDRE